MLLLLLCIFNTGTLNIHTLNKVSTLNIIIIFIFFKHFFKHLKHVCVPKPNTFLKHFKHIYLYVCVCVYIYITHILTSLCF